jgi:amidophosphoribosyltransferase
MCGIFGIYGSPETTDVAHLTYYGLYALQHRGQESAGIVVHGSRNETHFHKGMGLVSKVFNERDLEGLKGKVAIGHVRYSTCGDSNKRNIQPIIVQFSRGRLAIAHNGNLVNAQELFKRLEEEGSIFQTTTDTEIFAHLIAKSKQESFEGRVQEALAQVKGAYSLVLLYNGVLYGIRDPNGFRPLILGNLEGSYILASETCALDLLGAEFVREIEPGEMIKISSKGLESSRFSAKKESVCIFELVYFARPDSHIFNQSVYQARIRMGAQLAKESKTEADVVIPVPDSGVAAAIGFARESGIPYEMGLTRNHYVGRTFIQPSPEIRDLRLKIKLNPIEEALQGKRVIVVDDSIVRGTTCKQLIKLIRKAGAKEVHLKISSPPIRYPCFFGIDTPDRNQLIAATHSLEEIKDFLGVDSLQYLSLEGLRAAVKGNKHSYCDACFTGQYPVAISNAQWAINE